MLALNPVHLPWAVAMHLGLDLHWAASMRHSSCPYHCESDHRLYPEDLYLSNGSEIGGDASGFANDASSDF